MTELRTPKHTDYLMDIGSRWWYVCHDNYTCQWVDKPHIRGELQIRAASGVITDIEITLSGGSILHVVEVLTELEYAMRTIPVI